MIPLTPRTALCNSIPMPPVKPPRPPNHPWFKNLKPGDRVVYYQWHFPDEWPHAGIGTVRSHEAGLIVLEEIAGWTFRASDGNPVAYDEQPQLCTYIVPTTPALIDRVVKQRDSIRRYSDMRRDLGSVDWHRAHTSHVAQAHQLVCKPRGFYGFTL